MRYILFTMSLFIIMVCNAIDINNGNVKEDIVKLEQIANTNNSDAQYQLGKLYYDGKHIERSYQIAFKWLIKAGNNNNLDAELMVAEMYENGKGIFGDTEESMKWYEKASIRSNVAKYRLGCYLFNKNIDDEKALKLLEQAGEAGVADSYCVLARAFYKRYFSGGRKEGDDQKCIKYYAKAAELNDIEAICFRNILSPVNKEQLNSVREAANYGLGCAHYDIYFMFCFKGTIYHDEISRIEAYKSILIAEKLLGHNIRVEQKVTIDKFNFTKEEIEEATKQANEWKPKPLPPQPVVK